MRTRFRQRRRRADLAALFLIFICLVGTVAAVSVVVLARSRTALDKLGPSDASLNPIEQFILTVYLSTNVAHLTTPAGEDATPITFSVPTGATAAQVTENLVSANLIKNALLLNLYLRYRGRDDAIEAGDFILRQTMTPLEIASALADATARDISVLIIEGWRLEQVGESLSANPNLDAPYSDVIALAGPNAPHPFNYAFLQEIPPSASLEGFLFPDTYIVHPGANAQDLISRMLANFEQHLPDNYRASIARRGLTLYQAITIASLIEREAVQDDERPIIASVILNRLVIGQPLQIDATVQYIVATSANWWPPVSDLDFRAIDSPYNTYVVTGLPSGPIANPRAASIVAVASPADTNYLYYRALCDGSGRHAFAATYEEHLANECQ
jgi:peptidoglycan lytic transglycosylase G